MFDEDEKILLSVSIFFFFALELISSLDQLARTELKTTAGKRFQYLAYISTQISVNEILNNVVFSLYASKTAMIASQFVCHCVDVPKRFKLVGLFVGGYSRS